MNIIGRLFIRGHVLLYRFSGGRLGRTMRGHSVVFLTTRGRKTGAKRQVPVMPLTEGDTLYVIASLGGAPHHPAWFHNLRADPNVEVQRGSERWRARAVVLPREERDRMWRRVVDAMPGFAAHQTKTERVIPIVQLLRQT